jgi:hypothetical protein
MQKEIVGILIFLVIIGIIIYFYINAKTNAKTNVNNVNNVNNLTNLNVSNKSKPYLWLYWEGILPAYIEMCRETIYAHCSSSFNIVTLGKDNIDEWLPELNEKKLDFSKLKIAQRVDFYRILLLYKYGGLYMDMDIIAMRDPIEIMDKLLDNDFVGFGCTGNICKYGYKYPSNWLLASRPNTKLMRNVLKSYEEKLNTINNNKIENKDINYFDFGKHLIWKELHKLIDEENYTYYHYKNKFDGTRDASGHWVTMRRLFSDEKILYEDEQNLMLVVLYNSDLDDFDKSFRTKTKQELLNYNINFSKFYKKSLNL